MKVSPINPVPHLWKVTHIQFCVALLHWKRDNVKEQGRSKFANYHMYVALQHGTITLLKCEGTGQE